MIQSYYTIIMEANHTPRPNVFFCAGIIMLVILAIAVFFFQSNFLTIDSDLTYHMATAQSLVRDGGLSTQETWDSLPLGRPHLYPPVFHFLMAIPVFFNFPPMATIKLFNWLAIVGLAAISWFYISKIFSFRAGFFYLFALTSSMSIIRVTGTTIPASIAFALSPLLLVLIKKRSYIGATALMTIILYTHMIFPWFVMAALMIWAFYNRQYFSHTLHICLAAIALYLPWLLFIAKKLVFLRYFQSNYTAIAEASTTYIIPVTLIVLFLLSMILTLIYFRNKIINRDIIFFLALSFVTLPIAYFEYGRYVYSIGIWAIIVFTAVIFSYMPDFWPKEPFIKQATAILFISLLVFSINLTIKGNRVQFSNTPHFFYQSLSMKPNASVSGHFNNENLLLAEKISGATHPRGIIMNIAIMADGEIYQPHRTYILPQLFAALSDRLMANLRSPEYKWQTGINLNQVDILIANQDQINKNGDLIPDKIPVGTVFGGTDEFIKNFRLFSKTDGGLNVYQNIKLQPIQLPAPYVVMPLWLGWLIIALALFAIGRGLFKTF